MLDTFSKGFNVPKEVLIQNPDPNFVVNPDAETYVKAMDEASIDKGLVMLIDFGLSIAGEAKWSVEEMNQWVANQVAKYPDRLYALCGIDPRRGDRAIKLLEKAVEEWGMKGVKFYPVCGFYPDDPKFDAFYERCVELEVPIFSHTSIITMPLMESKYADPIHLDSVAAKFPDLKIVLIHLGGGFWTQKCVEIMSQRPNVYADISGHQNKAFYGTEEFLRLLENLFGQNSFGFFPIKHKLMFGTDWPAFETFFKDKDWVEWVKNIPEKAKEYDLKIKRSDIKNLLGNNAMKLLNL
jgi:predicted TIM-barrel fold metal-dependent hydrolase